MHLAPPVERLGHESIVATIGGWQIFRAPDVKSAFIGKFAVSSVMAQTARS
jgi:hypothetical protein